MISKPLIRTILFISILLLSSLACNAVMGFFDEEPEYLAPGESDPLEPLGIEEPSTGESPSEAETQPETPSGHPPATEALFCPAVMDRIIVVATEFNDKDTGDESSEDPEQLYLVTYSVSGDQISDPYFEDVSPDLDRFQQDENVHHEIWDYFVTLIPSSERKSLAEYSIVTDGEGNILAAVAQTFYDPALWGLEVDIRDSHDKLNLTYTLIHEYAHLLTLGPDQVKPSIAVFNNPEDDDIYYNEVNACPEYFPGEGCSRTDSYINTFFNQYWADIHEEWQDINLIEDDEPYYEALDDFYYAYEDRFVSDYAVTNPEEDIAESFTFFILLSRPNSDTITEQKILFFYQYPELVRLRDEIRNRVCILNQ